MDRYDIKSMTAYGRGIFVFPMGRFTIEIQSVNRRFLEINLSLPKLFMRYEMDMRQKLSSLIGRGALNVTLTWKPEGSQAVSVTPNLPLAHALKRAWERLITELHVTEPFPLSALFTQERGELLSHEEEIVDEKSYLHGILTALSEAIQALIGMKKREGQLLAEDIMERLKTLRKEIEQIEDSSQGAVEKLRLKLKNRLDELFSNSSENEERILREVAVFAEKADITEEIVRFKGHLQQFQTLMRKPLENELELRGKTLDFLLQELLREANTIGSKASDLIIAQHVVTLKSELEKIREQVQNIE